eukprot:SM000394S14739  [mRNA]  locus=s394:50279:50524:+ [translate_table: standard]
MLDHWWRLHTQLLRHQQRSCPRRTGDCLRA